jgi:gas vesicle protein
MYYDDERGTIGFLAGLAVGVVLGAGVALLTAPQSGRRTREQIAKRAEEWGELASDQVETAGDRLHDAADEVRKAAEDTRRVAERAGKKVRGQVKRTRKRLSH